MDLSPPRRRPMRESVVPMINVVFLLLIFFLMTAQIAPPDPVDTTPPVVTLDTDPLDPVTQAAWLGPQGMVLADGTGGDAALAALAEARAPVTLHADAALPAADLARALRDLGAAGLSDVTLVVRPGAATP